MQLILNSNSASNPQTLDLSSFVRVSDGEGLDPAASSFTQRVFQRSLLKAGATLALTAYTERELQFPLRISSTTSSGCVAISQQIAQIIETPGATVTWQDDGLSTPTTFDLVVGTWEVQYRYREAQQHFLPGLLRLFAQPFGRTAGPRPYAAASGVGPLLMITPYASGGGQIIGASTQAGVAGYGAGGQGGVPSSGVFYRGSPSLAGDAPALMQVSYVGPLPNTATNAGVVPVTAISILPGPLYRPLITAREILAVFRATGLASEAVISQSTAVASSYRQAWTADGAGQVEAWQFNPLAVASYSLQEPTVRWAGQHRLFAIARASGGGDNPALLLRSNSLTTGGASAVIPRGFDWSLYDLGTFALRASEAPNSSVVVSAYGVPSQAIDLTAFVMLPDNATWFFNPRTLSPSQYGVPSTALVSMGRGGGLPGAPYTNTLLIDDVIGDQFIYSGASQSFAPSPIGSVPSSSRITQFSRGLIPRPDPKDGLPIIAILGIPPPFASPLALGDVGASWTNQQNLPTYAQVSVLERSRYQLP